MIGVLFFALTIPFSAVMADKYSNRRMLMSAAVLVMIFGLVFQPLFAAGSTLSVLVFLCLGLGLMGLTYGPIGTSLSSLFPTAVRYTGASLTFNLAGILGGSFAPYIAKYLGDHYGLQYVGFYLSAAGLLTFLALLLLGKRANGA
jgi:MFS family permease